MTSATVPFPRAEVPDLVREDLHSLGRHAAVDPGHRLGGSAHLTVGQARDAVGDRPGAPAGHNLGRAVPRGLSVGGKPRTQRARDHFGDGPQVLLDPSDFRFGFPAAFRGVADKREHRAQGPPVPLEGPVDLVECPRGALELAFAQEPGRPDPRPGDPHSTPPAHLLKQVAGLRPAQRRRREGRRARDLAATLKHGGIGLVRREELRVEIPVRKGHEKQRRDSELRPGRVVAPRRVRQDAPVNERDVAAALTIRPRRLLRALLDQALHQVVHERRERVRRTRDDQRRAGLGLVVADAAEGQRGEERAGLRRRLEPVRAAEPLVAERKVDGPRQRADEALADERLHGPRELDHQADARGAVGPGLRRGRDVGQKRDARAGRALGRDRATT